MAKQLEFEKVNGWGGKRSGAGRKNRTGRVSHAKRERVDFRKPLHITMKIKERVANLRNRQTLHHFRDAVQSAKPFGLHVIHYSLQNDHVHLIVEAKDNDCLGRGMKSLTCRFAKSVRRLIGGSGAVFKGRFHVHVLRTPTEMKRALEYVLLNTAKHMKVIEHIDEYSSGVAFREWKALLGRRLKGMIATQIRKTPGFFKELSEAQSWLCQKGWMRAP
ncbi:MAG: transposase [Bdellovibrionales bacterium]